MNASMNTHEWPFNTRIIASIAPKLGLSFAEHSNGEGYLFSLTSSSGETFMGTGPIDSYPINTSTSSAIARDKFFSYLVATQLNIPTIQTELFFLSNRFSAARAPGREMKDLLKTVKDRAFPIFAKPNKGSRGDFAEVIESHSEFKSYIKRVTSQYDQIILQPYRPGSEVRLFMIDDACFFQYEKMPIKLKGDDTNTWNALIDLHNRWLVSIGLSEIPTKAVSAQAEKQGLSFSATSKSNQFLNLPGRRNISAHSSHVRFTTDIDLSLKASARRLMTAIGLRVAAIDFILPGRERNANDPQPLFLEINGNPSIDSLEKAGRSELAEVIWYTILKKWSNAKSYEEIHP